ncbi:MAG: acyl--CoA ligase [Bacteroidales bacterium]|nr:acyl--CoA ligase [Bacteroidales bacterium]
MKEKTFRALAERCFTEHRDRRLAVETSGNQVLSYTEGYQLVQLASAQLRQQGIGKGDIILTYTPLSLESVILCWACLYNGVVFVPVDHNWPLELLQFILKETAPKIVLTDASRVNGLAGMDYDGMLLLAGSQQEYLLAPLFLEWLSPVDPEGKEAEVMVQGLDASTSEEMVSPNDLAVILYTSGSTGLPKGVMLSQQALFNSGHLIATHFRWEPGDLFMNLGDLHSMSGLRNTCFAPLHAGASFVIASPEERNNILLSLELIQALGITYLGVAPTVIRQMNILCSESRKSKTSSLKAVMCTGGPLTKEQLRLFWENYGIPVLNYYGLTETAGICSGHTLDTFDPEDNSIGPASGAELIVFPSAESDDEEGTGELLVKSENLMSGYYKREEETSRVLKNGCFYTGDIVRQRTDGCFELLGRKRNIVKNIHSELIYLEEIENALESHPSVLEAATCPYARLEEDEKIVAFVVCKDCAGKDGQQIINDIRGYMAQKVGKNRMPWCYYLEEQLPRSTAGKIQRQLLNEKLNGYIKEHRTGYF